MYWRDILAAMEKLLAEGKKAALATVVESLGSTPRHPGAKMLIGEDGIVVGTIGGGCPEAEVFAAAEEAMESGRPRKLVLRYNEKDNPEGMICGGEMHVFIEPVMERLLYIFGGGHVSRALAKLCDFVGLPYVVVEERAQWANESRFPGARELMVGSLDEILPRLEPPSSALVVIATRSTREDEKVLRWALSKSLAYLGLLGSKTKRLKLVKKMEREGLKGESLHCPVGIEIGAETPEEIAVSIVAELISVMRTPRDC